MIGGLANSPYITHVLGEWGTPNRAVFSWPHGSAYVSFIGNVHERLTALYRTKALASGSLACALNGAVVGRICKAHYGMEVRVPVDAGCKGRPVFRDQHGKLFVEGAWRTLVRKVRTSTFIGVQSTTLKSSNRVILRGRAKRHAISSVQYGPTIAHPFKFILKCSDAMHPNLRGSYVTRVRSV
jgi:hypothetical protein